MSSITSRLSYANIIASLALFIALGGVSVAAATLPGGSVGSRQLKANAVSTEKVRDGSLLAKDFKPGQLLPTPRGLAGAQGVPGSNGTPGAKGDPGPKGDPGAPGATNVLVRTQSADVNGAGLGDGQAPTGWQTQIKNDSAATASATGYAVCARR